MKPSDRLRDIWLELYRKYPVGEFSEPPSFETIVDEDVCPLHTQLRLKLRALGLYLNEEDGLSDALDHAESEEDEECNCDQALALKAELAAVEEGLHEAREMVESLQAKQYPPSHDLLPDFFKAVDKEIEQPNGGTLADLFDDKAILGRLISETGQLSDLLYGMAGFDVDPEKATRSTCVKIAALAMLVLIRKQNDEADPDS